MKKNPMIEKNLFGVRVKKCCASCKHKVITEQGIRHCTVHNKDVESGAVCCKWQMSDQMKRIKTA